MAKEKKDTTVRTIGWEAKTQLQQQIPDVNQFSTLHDCTESFWYEFQQNFENNIIQENYTKNNSYVSYYFSQLLALMWVQCDSQYVYLSKYDEDISKHIVRRIHTIQMPTFISMWYTFECNTISLDYLEERLPHYIHPMLSYVYGDTNYMIESSADGYCWFYYDLITDKVIQTSMVYADKLADVYAQLHLYCILECNITNEIKWIYDTTTRKRPKEYEEDEA